MFLNSYILVYDRLCLIPLSTGRLSGNLTKPLSIEYELILLADIFSLHSLRLRNKKVNYRL